MADYYVTSAARGGSDANPGTLLAPWETVAKVNGFSFAVGDPTKFDRGVTWREELIVPRSGAAGTPMIFGAYGSGALPKISGANVFTGWTADAQPNTWQVACATEPNVVLFDGSYGYRKASLVAVDSQFDWYWQSPAGPLYVYSTSDPDSAYATMEAGQRLNAVRLGASRSYLLFQDLELTTANRYGFVPYPGAVGDNITFQRCALTNNADTGIRALNADLQTNYLIENCTSSRNGTFAVQMIYACLNWTIRGLVSYRDGIVEDDWEDYAGSHVNSGGIKMWGGTITEAADFGLLIENCDISYAGYRDDGFTPPEDNKGFGIWVDQLYALTPAFGVTVRNNRTSNCRHAGLYIEKCSYTLWHHNVSYTNEHGIRFETQSPLTSTVFQNLVAHNVCYGNLINIRCQGSTGAANTFYNNTVKNNICFGSTGTGHKEFSAYDGAHNDGTNGHDNVYTYNCFGTEYASFIKWGASDYSTYATWNAAAGAGAGVTDNYLNADPLFVNAASNDFRLTPASPARNAGVAIAGINDGYVGTAPDLGAYEFAVGGTGGGRQWSILGGTWRGFR